LAVAVLGKGLYIRSKENLKFVGDFQDPHQKCRKKRKKGELAEKKSTKVYQFTSKK